MARLSVRRRVLSHSRPTAWLPRPALPPRNTAAVLNSVPAKTVWTGSTTPKSTSVGGFNAAGSLSWSVGDRVYVIGVGADQSGFSFNTPSTAGSNLGGFASIAGPTTAASSTRVQAWMATATGVGSGTISQSVNGTQVWGIVAWAVAGSDGVGNVATATATGSPETVSLVRSDDHALVLAVVADWGAASPTGHTWSPSGQTEREATTFGTDYTIYAADWGDQGTAGTTSYGVTVTASGQNYSKIALEILGTTVTAGGGSRTAADTATATDTASASVVLARSTSDTASASDIATRAQSLARTAADTASATDTASRAALALARTTADTASATDTATRTAPRSRTATDTANASDAAVGVGAGNSRTASDTAQATDVATRTWIATRTAADTASAADTATRTAPKTRTAGDTASASDAATRTAPRARTASDSAAASDTAAGSTAGNLQRAAADTATATDTATRSALVRVRSAADTAQAADAAVRTAPKLRSSADTAAAADAAVQSLVRVRSAVDTAAAVDSASGSVVQAPPFQPGAGATYLTGVGGSTEWRTSSATRSQPGTRSATRPLAP